VCALDEEITVEHSLQAAQAWVSIRLSRREVSLIDKLADRTGQTRGSLLKQILVVGLSEYLEAKRAFTNRERSVEQPGDVSQVTKRIG
jgi:hypothetical protein